MSAAQEERASRGPAPSDPNPISEDEVAMVTGLLKGGAMFNRCSTQDLRELARAMRAKVFDEGDDLVTQGEASTTFWVVESGEALRLRADAQTHILHHVDANACGPTINSLQLLSGDPVFATARCVSKSCRAFGMDRDSFMTHIDTHPSLARGMIVTLSRDARRRSKLFRTPLLQQNNASINFSAVTIASAVESYYRSALNSLLNARLSGVSSPYFPNMHVQVPTRVLYINGFKGLRALFDSEVHPDQYSHPNGIRLATMFAPGLLMTPVSSFLEACNAGHANPEPLARRSLRGTVPRGVREVIFGVGINQMSDFFEERYRTMSPNLQISSNPLVANMAGSVTAGVIAGYLSHVPHNISTYKLLEPHKSYRTLFKAFVDKSVPDHLIPRRIPQSMLPATRIALACLFPRGVVIRTFQIVGSFVILNGGIQALQTLDERRFGSAIASLDSEK